MLATTLRLESLESRRLAVGCDVNGDAVCDMVDLHAEIQIGIGASSSWGRLYYGEPAAEGELPQSADFVEKYDINGDGAVTFKDVDDFFAVAELQPGDYNADSLVNTDDFLTLWDASPDMRALTELAHAEAYAIAHPEDDMGWFVAIERQSLIDLEFGESIRHAGFDTMSALDRTGVPTLELRGDSQDPWLSVFSLRDGDVNNDGQFNSSDLVDVASKGLASELDTGELVRIFQLGTYEN